MIENNWSNVVAVMTQDHSNNVAASWRGTVATMLLKCWGNVAAVIIQEYMQQCFCFDDTE